MSPTKRGPNDESRARTREALLQAGADLLVENAQGSPFAALTLRGICERAGRSTGAFYLHWPDVAAFYSDLAKLLAADDAFDNDMALLEEVGEACAEASVLTAIARVADRDLQLLLDNRLYDAMELLNVTWGRSEGRAEMAHGYRASDGDIGRVYGTILAARGREPRPPLDWERIGAILQALIEGFTLRHKVDPTAGARSSKSDLGLYATAVAAVLAVVTRPAGDDATFGQTAEALLGGPAPPPAPADGTATPATRSELDSATPAS
jgi:AcrR family transcriptional regulator